jgi:sec-independent protein translocase protein TatB
VFDLGFGEMLVIAVLVIVFVGPDGLPDMMRVLGRFYAQIRRASDDLRRTFNAEVARVESDRRRDELRQRREARELARAEGRKLDDAAPVAEDGGQPPLVPAAEDPAHAVFPADPRLPPDAAPRALPRPPVSGGAVPRPNGLPVRAAQPTFDGAELPASDAAPGKEP